MTASYSVYVSDPFGVRLGDASNFEELTYTRVTNDIGNLTLTLPSDFDTGLLRIPDGRVEVWRNIDGREYLDTDTVWLIKAVSYARDDAGLVRVVVSADTPLCLLREPGRFVKYFAGEVQSTYSAAPADDQIKDVVRQNLTTDAAAFRQISAYLTVTPDLSLGASVAKSFAWRDCLKVCQEFAQASAQAGTYVAFDIVSPSPDTMEFRTFTGQRGVDHRFPSGLNPIILSPEMGNLGDSTLTRDYRDEVTYVLVGGQGENSARVTASAQDNTRIGMSPFGVREQFIDYTNTADTTILTDVADGAVRAGRPKTIFRGKILETKDTRYGVHWAWGDYVTAQDYGQSFDCRIDAVTVTVKGGLETIEAYLRYDA